MNCKEDGVVGPANDASPSFSQSRRRQLGVEGTNGVYSRREHWERKKTLSSSRADSTEEGRKLEVLIDSAAESYTPESTRQRS